MVVCVLDSCTAVRTIVDSAPELMCSVRSLAVHVGDCPHHSAVCPMCVRVCVCVCANQV